MSITPRQHIETLYNERIGNTLWCKSQADVANFADGCLYGRFLNELLQNTDDSGGIELTFELEGTKLVITHDGRHFNQTDVEKIISFSNQEFRDKSTNTQMTGYKGIGFKALLSLTAKVHIISGGYSFRFDQAAWKDYTKKMPWQMIPIWTEVKEELLLTKKVVFIFHLTRAAFIEKEFDNFLTEPRPTLFLRHIRKIAFKYKGKRVTVERKDSKFDRSLCSPCHTSRWIVYSKEIPIPETLHQAIQEINTTICPDRLKIAKTIEVTFAFIVDNGKLSSPAQAHDLELFNTLPTKMKIGLPFAVNAEFLLEAQREHLVRSEWNSHLFQYIAYLHFLFLSEFAKGEHWKDILNILAPITLSGIEKELSDSYSKGFKAGYKNIAWIPSSTDPLQLLKLEECYADETGFYEKFKSKLPPSLIPKDMNHPHLNNLKKLYHLLKTVAPTHILNVTSIIDQLEAIFQYQADPELCYHVLVFLKDKEPKHYSLSHHFALWNQLKEKAFVPAEDGSLKKLSQLSLPQKKSQIPTPDFIEVTVMHPAIFELDVDGSLKSWLSGNGVSDLSIKNILKKHIRPLCEPGKLTLKQSYKLVHYLFSLFSQGLITNSDLKDLQTLPLLTQNGTLRSARETYLAKAYQEKQELSLEDLLPNHSHLFVSVAYIEACGNGLQWREFFLGLGLTEKLDLHIVKSSSVNGLFEKNIDSFKEYLKYLHSGPKPIIGRSYLTDDYYRNIVFFPMMGSIKDPLFAQFFWNRLSLFGPRFIEADTKCEFIDRKNTPRSLMTYDKVSYIRYVLNATPCIPGTDGKMHKITDLYSPSFRFLNSSEITAAAIETPLSSELVQYLGFKTHISPSNCYTLLKEMKTKSQGNLELYTTLIRELLIGWESLDTTNRQHLLKQEWFFLAHNNEWVNVHSLSCFSVKGASPSLNSNSYFKMVSKEVEALATLFNRPVVQDWVQVENIQEAKDDQLTKNKLFERLPLIAWFYAHWKMQPQDIVLKELVENVRKLQIFHAALIPTCDKHTFLDISAIKNTIYYTDKCNKHTLIETVGELLELPSEIKKELWEVCSLKEERSTRRRKTIDDWIKEKSIPLEELLKLQELIKTLDLTPIYTSPNQQTFPLPQSYESLPETMIEIDESLSSSDEEDNRYHPEIERVSNQLGQLTIHTSLSPGIPQETPWAPTIPVSNIQPSQKGIQKLKSNRKEPISPIGKADKAKCPKSPSKPSGQGNPEMGKWGEAFALKELLSYYEKKHGTNFQETSTGSYHLTQKGVVEIGLHWLNQIEESGESYDFLLTKKKEGSEEIICPVEVKATKGESIHFFMSDGEWKIMKTNPKYRLYMILHAGEATAEMHKISNPKEWVRGDTVRIKKKYEISLSRN
ncbi:MAG: DUF3883 domain-containing protein [Halobacteriovoraceae bacterium]|nr:DUF3883 domain-containing protein [Halobacteriovoraceae bacterium]